jgi:hypothetical protein
MFSKIDNTYLVWRHCQGKNTSLKNKQTHLYSLKITKHCVLCTLKHTFLLFKAWQFLCFLNLIFLRLTLQGGFTIKHWLSYCCVTKLLPKITLSSTYVASITVLWCCGSGSDLRKVPHRKTYIFQNFLVATLCFKRHDHEPNGVCTVTHE